MTNDSVEKSFAKLNVWRRRDERAPHKPLLLLLALAEYRRGNRVLKFAECELKIAQLLQEFGTSTKSVHPEYPFWRLQKDSVWAFQTERPLLSGSSGTDPTRTELRAANATGSLDPRVLQALERDPQLLDRLALQLLEAHFPSTLHEDILCAIGLDLAAVAPIGRRRRDPNFRNAVLTAYQYRCAVCALDLRIGSLTIGLEAAHVKWHQANGPDLVHNGVALCNLHHKLFDLGAFTLDPALRIFVSEQVHGTTRFEEVLLRYHGALALPPLPDEHRPLQEFVGWHHTQVFKRDARPYSHPGT